MLLDFNNMATATLVDLLAQETQKFTQLMAEKRFTEEYVVCKDIIHQLQAIIESRSEAAPKGDTQSLTSPETVEPA